MQRLENKANEMSQNVEQKDFCFKKVRHEETIQQTKWMLTAAARVYVPGTGVSNWYIFIHLILRTNPEADKHVRTLQIQGLDNTEVK